MENLDLAIALLQSAQKSIEVFESLGKPYAGYKIDNHDSRTSIKHRLVTSREMILLAMKELDNE